MKLYRNLLPFPAFEGEELHGYFYVADYYDSKTKFFGEAILRDNIQGYPALIRCVYDGEDARVIARRYNESLML